MACPGEVWKSLFECQRVGRLHKHERHGRAEEDDMGVSIVNEVFPLEVSGTSQPGRQHQARAQCRKPCCMCRMCQAYSSQNEML